MEVFDCSETLSVTSLPEPKWTVYLLSHLEEMKVACERMLEQENCHIEVELIMEQDHAITAIRQCPTLFNLQKE